MSDEMIPVCPDCGMRQPKENAACWLCGKKVGPEDLFTYEQATQMAKRRAVAKECDPHPAGGYWSQGVMFILWGLVGVGILAANVVAAVAYVVVGGPALYVFFQADCAENGRLSFGFLRFLVIALLVGLGLVIALAAACFAILSGVNVH